MRSDATVPRRRLLGCLAGAAALGPLTGCGGPSEGAGTPENADDASGAGASTETPDGTPETSDGSEPNLDLREANVVDVVFESRSGAYTFDVTLHHDDDGEDGYANWWQVERLDGTRLGRRDLLHAHSRQPFTRSETIEIPGDVRCVVVRGHDQTHGYGGRATLVDLESSATRAVVQGPERQAFEESDCP